MIGTDEQFESMFRGLPDGITVQDPTGRLIYANDVAARITGYPSAGAMLNASVRDVVRNFEVMDESGQRVSLDHLPGRLVLDGAPSCERTFRFRIKDTGEERWVVVKATPVHDELGNVRLAINTFQDITLQKRAEDELSRRDAILEAVRYAAERFLAGSGTWEESVQEVLARLGRAADVSRVYIFENQEGPDGRYWARQRYEWVAPGVAPQIQNPLLRDLRYQVAGFGSWEETMRRGQLVHGHARHFSPAMHEALSAQDIKSLVLVPISVEEHWWGFIGFDECVTEREWSITEMDTLKAAASTLGAAIQRNQAEARLRAQEQQYRSVFESTSDGLIIRDLSGRIVEANPAMCRMHGYTREEFVNLDPAEFIHPDYRGEFVQCLNSVIAGEEVRSQRVDVRKDGTPFHVEVHQTRFTYRGERHILGVVRDVTERLEAYQLLEQRVRERTRELSTLLEVSRNVASTLELKPLLELILDQLKVVVEYSGAAIYTVDGEELRIAGYRGPIPESEVLQPGFRFPSQQANREVIRRREPVLIPDVRGDSELALSYQLRAGEELETTYGYVRSWMGVPVMHKDRVLGMLSLVYDEPGHYVPHHAELALAMANQAAVAIENARLYEQAQEAARRTKAMAQIASSVALGGSLEETLDELCQHVVEATGTVAAAVALGDREPQRIRVVGTYGHPPGYEHAVNQIIRSGVKTATVIAFEQRTTVVARDGRRTTLANEQCVPLHPFMRVAEWDTFVAVPMMYGDTAVGVLAAYYPPSADPGESEIAFLNAIANQAATAVENARLFTEVEKTAVLEERQRLARELHDSVSQALYGIGLGARTARALLDRDPALIAQPLDYVLSLAEAGLAEMRALIFELRPESLEVEGIVAALDKQAASLRARHNIEVNLRTDEEPDVPLETKEALYRIAQEAMHNTVKHAKASTVEVSLRRTADRVWLEICDDGVGFDPTGEFPGHLGLRSMRERAARLGGDVDIESVPGEGTRLRASIPEG